MNGAGKSKPADDKSGPSIGLISVTRQCAGPCRRRRSIAQYKADSPLCNICTKRTPK